MLYYQTYFAALGRFIAFQKTEKNIDYTVPADETSVPQDLILLLLLRPQISKGVNDHTKDQVKYNNNDYEEERKVVYNTREEPERRISKQRQNFDDFTIQKKVDLACKLLNCIQFHGLLTVAR